MTSHHARPGVVQSPRRVSARVKVVEASCARALVQHRSSPAPAMADMRPGEVMLLVLMLLFPVISEL